MPQYWSDGNLPIDTNGKRQFTGTRKERRPFEFASSAAIGRR
jgi:hypothetical protein